MSYLIEGGESEFRSELAKRICEGGLEPYEANAIVDIIKAARLEVARLEGTVTPLMMSAVLNSNQLQLIDRIHSFDRKSIKVD